VPLQREVEAGRFRADLFYRLDVVGFFLPALRERRASVRHLAGRFLAEFAARNRSDVDGFSPVALAALETYGWPGNVRELRNVVERAVALCPGNLVGMSDLPEAVRAVYKKLHKYGLTQACRGKESASNGQPA
jgi:DNA-binding NtrC family response regulator